MKDGEKIVEAPCAYTEKISINFIKVSSWRQTGLI